MEEMRGRVCLVTGATSGIGRATAAGLARRGATVVLGAREAGRGRRVLEEIRGETGNEALELLVGDLSRLADVRGMAAEFKERHDRLHVLVNNAGTIFPARRRTEEGLETTFVVNHLAPFLLTNLLLDRLVAGAPARVVNVVSATHRLGRIDPASLPPRGEKGGLLADWRAYNRSKLATVLFTCELARRLEGTGVTVNCLHPGLVATNAGGEGRGLLWGTVNRYRGGLVRLFLKLPRTFLLTPKEGARTSLFLACSPEVEGVTGRYFVGCVEARSSRTSYDRGLAERLWRVDAEVVGLGHS